MLAQKSKLLSQNEIIKEVTTAYYNLLYGLQRVKLLQQQDSIYSNFLKRATLRYNTGETNQLEKMQAESKAEGTGHAWDYLYEPDAQTVIDELLVRYVEALVFQALAENMASEHAARMVAMKAATDNAGNVIGELKLVYNKTRQAAITKELSEIVSGAAAIGA